MAEVAVARPGRALVRALLAADVARSQGGDASVMLHSGVQVSWCLKGVPGLVSGQVSYRL